MRLFKIIPAAVAFLSFCKSGHAGVLDKNVVDNLQSQLEDQLGLDKRTYIPKLSNVYCGDNTKDCNIGFTYLYVEMYKFRWEMLTPRATIIETFRKEKKDKYEYVSMVTTMSNYNIFFPVYISGEISSGGCINDKGNTCTLDKFLDQPKNDINAAFTFKNIDDKEVKYGRFKYSDWTGKCYKTWALTFDIQGTKEDLEKWAYYKSVNFADFE